MGRIRPCKYCGGGHRRKSVAKKCYLRHSKAKAWGPSDFGYSGKK